MVEQEKDKGESGEGFSFGEREGELRPASFATLQDFLESIAGVEGQPMEDVIKSKQRYPENPIEVSLLARVLENVSSAHGRHEEDFAIYDWQLGFADTKELVTSYFSSKGFQVLDEPEQLSDLLVITPHQERFVNITITAGQLLVTVGSPRDRSTEN